MTGDAGVGKSNFLLRYVVNLLTKITIRINHLYNRYVKDKYRSVSATIGVEFAYKVAVLKNKTKVKA